MNDILCPYCQSTGNLTTNNAYITFACHKIDYSLLSCSYTRDFEDCTFCFSVKENVAYKTYWHGWPILRDLRVYCDDPKDALNPASSFWKLAEVFQ